MMLSICGYKRYGELALTNSGWCVIIITWQDIEHECIVGMDASVGEIARGDIRNGRKAFVSFAQTYGRQNAGGVSG
jgi:hypothetical protein